MNNNKIINDLDQLADQIKHYPEEKVDSAILYYSTKDFDNIHIDQDIRNIINLLIINNFDATIYSVIKLFELLLDEETKTKNGIVFTPHYIADYIVEALFSDIKNWDKEITIIDPSCGCGTFLVSAIEFIHNKYNISITELIKYNIYGLDIEATNIRRCKIVLNILTYKYGEKHENIQNIKCIDSLRIDWKDFFQIKHIKYIIGNPPYINPHTLNDETIIFLKNKFHTTTTGVWNIFYAFIEHSMNNLDKQGKLSFIIPNNFLTIKAATNLRAFIQNNLLLNTLIDFQDNMVFKPIRTYNCIIILDHKKNFYFKHSTISKTSNVKDKLKNLTFHTMSNKLINNSKWLLSDNQTMRNIDKIENQAISIKKFIKTGIATLSNDIYLVEKDDSGFFKLVNNTKYFIENDIIKTIYKVPDLKNYKSIDEAKKYIIFPYIFQNGYKIIKEDNLISQYPNTYKYLMTQKIKLESRDKGKINVNSWYAYGRSQGLNNIGKKLLFTTFAQKPNFILVKDTNALFFNGYAILENELFNIEIIDKILNSYIMEYYIKHTSYAIEGGYYCYQKKFIENFSLPILTNEEINFLNKSDKKNIDTFLISKYDLSL